MQNTAYSQNTQVGGSNFSIVSFKEKISSSVAPKFILKFKNYLNQDLKLPEPLRSVPEYDAPAGEIGFNIFYCPENTDTANCSNMVTLHLGYYLYERQIQTLKMGEEKIIEVNPGIIFFDQKGRYKVRFYFHMEQFVKTEKPISTPWVWVTVE